MLDRRVKLVVAAAIVLAIAYDAWLMAGGGIGLTTCPPFSGAVHMTLITSGFQSYVGGPLFRGQQLVLAPGSTGTVTMEMTSGFNITQYLEQINVTGLPLGPFGADNYITDVSRAYMTSTGWNTYSVSAGETGISVHQVSFVEVNDHNYTATYTVTAASTARTGVYQAPMFFNGWCSNYYLTIGRLPYTGTINGVPQAITPLLPFLLVALLGCCLFAFESWVRHHRADILVSQAPVSAPTS